MTFMIVITPWSWKSVILLNQILFYLSVLSDPGKAEEEKHLLFCFGLLVFCSKRRSSSISMHFLPAPAASKKTNGYSGSIVCPAVSPTSFHGQLVVNAHRTDPTWGLMSNRAVAKDWLACWHKHLRVWFLLNKTSPCCSYCFSCLYSNTPLPLK